MGERWSSGSGKKKGERLAPLISPFLSDTEDAPSCLRAPGLKIWRMDETRDCWIFGDLSSVGQIHSHISQQLLGVGDVNGGISQGTAKGRGVVGVDSPLVGPAETSNCLMRDTDHETDQAPKPGTAPENGGVNTRAHCFCSTKRATTLPVQSH